MKQVFTSLEKKKKKKNLQQIVCLLKGFSGSASSKVVSQERIPKKDINK